MLLFLSYCWDHLWGVPRAVTVQGCPHRGFCPFWGLMKGTSELSTPSSWKRDLQKEQGGDREGNPVIRTPKIASSQGPLPPCRGRWLLRQCWGILGRIPLLSSPYFKHSWAISPSLCKYLMPSPNIVQANTSQVLVLLQPSFHGDVHRISPESLSKSQHYQGIFIAVR